MDPFVAEIRIFPFNFAPKGWAFCNGQILPLSQNTALFSLLGTTYGGDGRSNFALPNLQGSAPMHPGQGPGLSLHDLGETGGEVNHSLLESEIPSHNHTMNAGTGGGQVSPANKTWGTLGGRTPTPLYNNTASNTPMAGTAFGVAGGGQPHNNMSPFLALNFCIALQGVFPPRT